MMSIVERFGRIEGVGKEESVQHYPVRPKVGISACLMGDAVRYNGGHQRDKFVMDVLAEHVELVPFCPEVEAGLGVPRPVVRIVERDEKQSLLESPSGTDHSESMNAALIQVSKRVRAADLDGFLLKRGSPTCGIKGVKVYTSAERKSRVVSRGSGFLTQRLAAEFKTLALAEEGWLNDAMLRQQFLNRIFTSHRLKQLGASPKLSDLQREYAAHKLLYMAHHPGAQRELGRQLAGLKGSLSAEQTQDHLDRAQGVLGHRLSRGRHVNVLQHMFGYVSSKLSRVCRRHTCEAIESYKRGQTSLLAPLTLLKHQVLDKGAHPWLVSQIYFDPYPSTLW